MQDNKRKYKLSFGELIERISINQLREMLIEGDITKFTENINDLQYDIEMLLLNKNISVPSNFIRLIIITAELNTLIWVYKDKMQENPDKYDYYLKKSHQLNGLRNRIKNKINLVLDGNKIETTNIEIDGLEGFNISI